jgi:hypothetical protein
MPPDPDEYRRVRNKLREIFEDYVLLYSMRGVQYDIDMYRDPSELDQRAKEALEDAKDLDGLLERIHTLATTDPRALEDEWASILEALECWSYHHQFLKGVRPLAKLWRPDIPRGRGGRPEHSDEFGGTREGFLARIRQSIVDSLAKGSHASMRQVAKQTGLSEQTLRRARKEHGFRDWRAVVDEIARE